ncbi:VOC family protein [Sphingomonas oligoaromativorans]|jgi:catechol 2,3-dioxygenase-like lactoylglutathione lyase family enzyme|uniref:VOC family protein n=1 Tax=Sphingomonas oligoaromativorans TaxID=575322 RepID=UPI0014217078|nr:VOC family protein [Sphingomonas oligoaromativorans]NIJ33942.1 catechol 2,3-dioxygenase-like lactoylglutathione lyase family enzyme [Sphingomonas oligoaromativorans]
MIERIGHINIRTPILKETIRFYEELFDLVAGPAQTMGHQEMHAWLYGKDGRAIIHVNSPPDGEAPIPPGVRARLDHIAFDCSDVGEMERRLTAFGVPFVKRATRVAGLTQIVLSDPNGIRLELAFGADKAMAPS